MLWGQMCTCLKRLQDGDKHASARLWGGRRLAAPRSMNNSLCEWGRPMSLPTRDCSSWETWARGLEHSRACFPDVHHALREQLARLHVSGEHCLPPALLENRVPLRSLKTLEGPVSENQVSLYPVPDSLRSFEFVFCCDKHCDPKSSLREESA